MAEYQDLTGTHFFDGMINDRMNSELSNQDCPQQIRE